MLLSVAIAEDALSVQLTTLVCDHIKIRMGCTNVRGDLVTKWTDTIHRLGMLAGS